MKEPPAICFHPALPFSSLVCTVTEVFMVFGCCQFHWREGRGAPMGLSAPGHTFGPVAYWHSCYRRRKWSDSGGWWTYLRTLADVHASHVCLLLLNVIKCSSDTAGCWLWWNSGALALLLSLDLRWFIQRLPHRMLQSFLAISCCCDHHNRSFRVHLNLPPDTSKTYNPEARE